MGNKHKIFKVAGNTFRLEELSNSKLPESIVRFVHAYQSGKDIVVNTSGSTGKPKPIFLKPEHMKASAQRTIRFLDLIPGDKCLLCMSPDYIAGMMMLVRWLEGDLDLYFTAPRKDPLRDFPFTIQLVALVPYQVFHSLDQLDKAENLLIGGGELSANVEGQLKRLNHRVFHTYGMTETITHIALREINPHFQQSFHALQGVKFTLDDRSCLVIDAPHIGVKNLVTRDVVELISKSEFRWLGRLDHVVNSGGIKLYPELLERELGDLGFTYILGGIPDAELGQKLVMAIESPTAKSLDGIQEKLIKLPKYSRPKEIRYVSSFDRTASGKFRRKEIIQKAFPD